MNGDTTNPLSNDDALELFKRCRTAVEAGLSIDAEEATSEVFRIVSEWVESNPSADWELTVEAAECESRGDWDGAEAAYKKVLVLAGSDSTGLFMWSSGGHRPHARETRNSSQAHSCVLASPSCADSSPRCCWSRSSFPVAP